MKKFLLYIFIIFALHLNAQTNKMTTCEQIEAAAVNGALIFKHEGKLYLVSLEEYHLYDIYTGNIYLKNYTNHKKPKRFSRQWDLFLLNRKFKYKILK